MIVSNHYYFTGYDNILLNYKQIDSDNNTIVITRQFTFTSFNQQQFTLTATNINCKMITGEF